MSVLKKIWEVISRREMAAIIVVSFLAGFLLRGGGPTEDDDIGIHVHEVTEEPAVEVWTCSMHPQIRQPQAGQCPICGMDLIPISEDDGGAELSERELRLSPAAAKLAGIQVAPVERKYVDREIRMLGRVEYDETRTGYISSWISGRIDRLFVDYTGMLVRKGDHLAVIYSPDLYSAQEELIQALRAVDELGNSELATIRGTAVRTVEASRRKLRFLGMTDDQIAEFEARGAPSTHVTIYSSMEGIVIHRNATEGMYMQTGAKIYTIADLSVVWVVLDVYESDLEWIRYGQEVIFRTEAYPGETFNGRIAFIDPVLDDKTRTVNVRVNVPNRDGKLKPEMFVRATVHSRVAPGGRVMDPFLAGKYISPMHPEVVKDGPGTCDVCGMPLVRAETLGYVDPSSAAAPLVIPSSAPLITGKRAVVYVAAEGRDGVFEGREVVLGPRAGDYYLVQAGLEEGESVVVNGNFKIDSAIQIFAGPSMMSPEGGITPAAHQHGQTQAQARRHDDDAAFAVPDTFRGQLAQVFQAYVHIQSALSADNTENASEGARHMNDALSDVDMSLLKGDAHMAWMDAQAAIMESGERVEGADDIGDVRTAFIALSSAMIAVATRFGISQGDTLYRFHCPMADSDKGADWLQSKSDLENPYFGAAMLKCGELVETIAGR